MGILGAPRIHFAGSARLHAPTGHRTGCVDVATNTVYAAGRPVDPSTPPAAHHAYLEQLGPRWNAAGRLDESGAFSLAMGWNFGGNGHFSIDAQVVSVQLAPGAADLGDPLVGTAVDLWGHHNEYLGTTFNRARVFEVDPASSWTTTLMVGQLAFGRRGGSHEAPYLFSGSVEGMHPARWQRFDLMRQLEPHVLGRELASSAVYQLAVEKTARDLRFAPEASASPALEALRRALLRPDVRGVAVRLALWNMSRPVRPDAPSFYELAGTIGVLGVDDLASYPAGRLLRPPRHGPRILGIVAAAVHAGAVSLDLCTAVPVLGRAPSPGPGPFHAGGPRLDLGDLELRTRTSGALVAQIPASALRAEAHRLTSGVVDAPLAAPFSDLAGTLDAEGLILVGPDGRVLAEEQEIHIQAERAALFVEVPDPGHPDGEVEEIELRSFVRGRPAAAGPFVVRQLYNPRGLPQLRAPHPQPSEWSVVGLAAGRAAPSAACASSCTVTTDVHGRAWLTLRAARPGTTRVHLTLATEPAPFEGSDAVQANDEEDRIGFWAGAGSLAVRVLPDDWHLAETPPERVDYDFLYRHVLAYYELVFSFMKLEVFSMADRERTETYARLMWQMCDPRNKAKTYYMPPTRDLSRPKALLLRTFLENTQRRGHVPGPEPMALRPHRELQSRAEVVAALQLAAELEAAITLQYNFAAWSIPNHRTGREYVRIGRWTAAQLALACGDGREERDHGLRGLLLQLAHEEMLHFLLVNNVLMALGEPFHPGAPDLPALGRRLSLDVDLALEPFGPMALARAIRLEQPDFLAEELPGEAAEPSASARHGFGSLSELYRQIRSAIERLPGLFLAAKGQVGGEHHLFLREDFNDRHPDYQLQVDDARSALFAIDLITEQGEGGRRLGPGLARAHFGLVRSAAAALAAEQQRSGPLPWCPAYPAVRNPSRRAAGDGRTEVTEVATRAVMELCDGCYALMLQLMVQHFGLMPRGSLRRSRLMNASIDVMTGMLRPLGELLVTMPSGLRGRTAGPAFELDHPVEYLPIPDVAYRAIAARFGELERQAQRAEVSGTVREMLAHWGRVFDGYARDPREVTG